MRRFVPMVFAFATLAAPVAAQGAAPAAHPDFVGTWKFDPKKSEGAGLPISMTLKAAKDAKVMTINRTGMTEQGEQRSLVIVNLDGSPTKNTVTTRAPGGCGSETCARSVDQSTRAKRKAPSAIGRGARGTLFVGVGCNEFYCLSNAKVCVFV